MADRPDGSHICTCGDCSPGWEDRCKYEPLAQELYEALSDLTIGEVTNEEHPALRALARYEAATHDS